MPFIAKYKGAGVEMGIILTRLWAEAELHAVLTWVTCIAHGCSTFFLMENIFAYGVDMIVNIPKSLLTFSTWLMLLKNWTLDFKWRNSGIIHSSSKYVVLSKCSLRISLTYCYHVTVCCKCNRLVKDHGLTATMYFLCFIYLGQTLNIALTYFLCGLISFVIISFI